jgi:hypothetical protein
VLHDRPKALRWGSSLYRSLRNVNLASKPATGLALQGDEGIGVCAEFGVQDLERELYLSSR